VKSNYFHTTMVELLGFATLYLYLSI